MLNVLLHVTKKFENGVTLIPSRFLLGSGSILGIPVKYPECEPMLTRQILHLGVGFLHAGQDWNRVVCLCKAFRFNVALIFRFSKSGVPNADSGRPLVYLLMALPQKLHET